MRPAIYARKSTEQSGVADEQKSVARQIDHARQYAVRKGWTVPRRGRRSPDRAGGALADVHARLAERRENYRIWTRTDARRKPEARGGRRSYLLSGFSSCGCSVQVISSGSTTGRLFRYGCGQ
jgi:hypothetical protein